jgi:AAA+ superfamily predicted ATPase
LGFEFYQNELDAKTIDNRMETKLTDNRIEYNANHLGEELQWFSDVFESRLSALIRHENQADFMTMPPVSLNHHPSVYREFITQYKLTPEERLLLILALIPHIQPQLIDKILTKHNLDRRKVIEVGGLNGTHHGGFIPTGETAIFLLAGNDLAKRFRYSGLLSAQSRLIKNNILKLSQPLANEPDLSSPIEISKEMLSLLTVGKPYEPLFNTNFPAKHITTNYNFEDVVLAPETLKEIKDIELWLDYGKVLLKDWGFGKYINAGYKSLFYGPPGTGKSLLATVLGNKYKMPVYRVDLSLVISKYIGETEKNLSTIFDMAQDKNWILFFDEADSLFGKRTQINDSRDRFANQEVSYLLMRMEEYNGLAILATNLRSNLDDAFARRFQSIVHFPMPNYAERLQLWQKNLEGKGVLDKNVNIEELAQNYAVSGANVLNVVRYASLLAINQNSKIIKSEYLFEGIKKEYQKEGRMI